MPSPQPGTALSAATTAATPLPSSTTAGRAVATGPGIFTSWVARGSTVTATTDRSTGTSRVNSLTGRSGAPGRARCRAPSRAGRTVPSARVSHPRSAAENVPW